DVEAEVRVHLDFRERMLELLREVRAVLEGRRRGHQRPGGRRERAHRALQDLRRSRPQDDVLGLGLVLGRERGDEVALARRAVERVAARLRELAEDRVERHFAGPERVLAAADPDFAGGWRAERTPGAAVLLRLGQVAL